MSRVVIIGAGLFGQVIGAELAGCGHEVRAVDASFDNAGSAPAACLMKPSWLSGFARQEREEALALLDRHYGVKELQFRLGPAKLGGIMWVDPRAVLSRGEHFDVLGDEVLALHERGSGYDVQGCAAIYEADIVILAAGIWCSRFAPVPGLKAQAGVAFTWEHHREMEPFVKPWAPYKQVVGFKRAEDELWVSDGSAINPENWKPERTRQCEQRCRDALGFEPGPVRRKLFGYRPYVPGAKPAYLRQHGPRLWVATGGAKNGTLAAAWCAGQLAKALA